MNAMCTNSVGKNKPLQALVQVNGSELEEAAIRKEE